MEGLIPIIPGVGAGGSEIVVDRVDAVVVGGGLEVVGAGIRQGLDAETDGDAVFQTVLVGGGVLALHIDLRPHTGGGEHVQVVLVCQPVGVDHRVVVPGIVAVDLTEDLGGGGVSGIDGGGDATPAHPGVGLRASGQ